MKKLGALALAFLKIGAFTFGGGYAMIALLEHEFVGRKQWIGQEEFLDMVAIAESTPGPIAINAATYIGYRTAGLAGAAAATVSVCLPSFVIIFIISQFFDAFLELRYVAAAFRGIQVCVVYLIGSAGLKLLKGLKKSWWNAAIVLGVTGAMISCSLLAVQFSSIFYILLCAGLGLAAELVRKLRKQEDTE